MRTPKHLICTKNFCSHCDIRSCLQRATEEEARRGTGAVRFIIHAYFHVIKLLEIVHQAVLPRMAIQSDSPLKNAAASLPAGDNSLEEQSASYTTKSRLWPLLGFWAWEKGRTGSSSPTKRRQQHRVIQIGMAYIHS